MKKLFMAGVPFICATLLLSGCGVDENGPGENRLVKSQADGSYGVKKSDSGANERRGLGGMDSYTGAGTKRHVTTGGGGDAYSGTSYGLGRQPINNNYGAYRGAGTGGGGGTVNSYNYGKMAAMTGLSSYLEGQLKQQGISAQNVVIIGDILVLGQVNDMNNQRMSASSSDVKASINRLFGSEMKVITVSSREALQAMNRIKGQLDGTTLARDIQTILNDGGAE